MLNALTFSKLIFRRGSKQNGFAKRFKRITSNRKFIQEIDGLRFVAILPVLIQHLSERILKYSPAEISSDWVTSNTAFYASRGTMGVYLFFVISGFILCIPFAKAYLNKTKAISYKDYFFKRISRLEPPYVFWMIFFFIILIINSDLGVYDLLPSLLASLFYVHNFAFGEYSVINPVAWSLEIELQFYLLAPFLAFIYFSISKVLLRRILIVALIIASPILQYYLGWNIMPWKASVLGQFQHFLLGFFLADLYLVNKQIFQIKHRIWDLIGVLSFLLMLFSWSDEWIKEILFSIVTAFFFLAAFKGPMLNSLIRNLYIVIIGGMCYTIYLIHLPLLELFISATAQYILFENFTFQFLFNAIIFIPVVLAISALFFLILEKPFMQRTWWKSNGLSRFPLFYSIRLVIQRKREGISIITIIILLSFAGNIVGQEQTQVKSELNAILTQELEPKSIELLPVEVLIELAIQRSPIIKSQQLKIENFNNDIKLINRKWLEYISVGGTYFYGTSSYLDAIETVGLVDYSVTNRKNSISNMHVSARIPISEIFTRQTKKEKVINEIQMEQFNKEIIENAIREAIITEHQIFTSKISMLQIKSNEVESLRLVSKVAEQYLREGNIEIDEYSSAVSKLSKAEHEFASIKHEARLSYLALLEIVGQPISKNENLQ